MTRKALLWTIETKNIPELEYGGVRQNTVQEGWHEEENQESEEKAGGHLSAL